MNFLELINKSLTELNYRTVSQWDALTLNDHARLKEILSRLNQSVCASENWFFLERTHSTRLIPGQIEIHNPIVGRINSLLIDGTEYHYTPKAKQFLLKDPVPGCFSTFGDHILLPKFNKTVECKILYNSAYSAIDEDNNEKEKLEFETDESLIPEPFQDTLLVYGACMRLKANPDHSKFKFWYSMYNDALATMRSKCASQINTSPNISVKRI